VNIVVKIHEPWGMDVTVQTAKAGEVFGWSVLVEPYIYTASAKCEGKVKEIYIKGSELRDLFEQNPHMGCILMNNLSASINSRLTETRKKLTKAIAAASHKDWQKATNS
jgi:CRP-like cAMP-binding protein